VAPSKTMTISQEVSVTNPTPIANPTPNFTPAQTDMSTIIRLDPTLTAGVALPVGVCAFAGSGLERIAPWNAEPQFGQYDAFAGRSAEHVMHRVVLTRAL
jgi:hypothetical protein